jgi:hypothetical protein
MIKEPTFWVKLHFPDGEASILHWRGRNGKWQGWKHELKEQSTEGGRVKSTDQGTMPGKMQWGRGTTRSQTKPLHLCLINMEELAGWEMDLEVAIHYEHVATGVPHIIFVSLQKLGICDFPFFTLAPHCVNQSSK